jgi:hypothetical protein
MSFEVQSTARPRPFFREINRVEANDIGSFESGQEHKPGAGN